jgi:hypothetical protein
MNEYQCSTPRLALGITAVAMTAATFGLFVFMPAMIGFGGDGPGTQAASTAPPEIKEAVIIERIEVRGVRETTVASATPAPVDASERLAPAGTDLPATYRVSAIASGSVMSTEGNVSSEKRPPSKQ